MAAPPVPRSAAKRARKRWATVACARLKRRLPRGTMQIPTLMRAQTHHLHLLHPRNAGRRLCDGQGDASVGMVAGRERQFADG